MSVTKGNFDTFYWNVYSRFSELGESSDCEIEGDFNDGQHLYSRVMNTLAAHYRKTAMTHLVSSRGMLKDHGLS